MYKTTIIHTADGFEYIDDSQTGMEMEPLDGSQKLKKAPDKTSEYTLESEDEPEIITNGSVGYVKTKGKTIYLKYWGWIRGSHFN